jgi:acyl-CoA dehydrogenase
LTFAGPASDVAEVLARTRTFVKDVCLPAESRFPGPELDGGLRAELQAEARQAGVFAPHVPIEFGGLGLDIRGWSVVFEEAGYSIARPSARCSAAGSRTSGWPRV